MRHFRLALFIVFAVLLGGGPRSRSRSYLLFESGPGASAGAVPNGRSSSSRTRPTATSRSSTSAPAACSRRAAASRSGSSRSRSPRAHNAEVWVVNHLSDSVSIVDVASSPPRVVRTLLVGDEPRDIVFAGTRRQPRVHHHRAPRPAAHPRSIAGVTGAGDPQLTTEGIGRADVWVFDATNLGTTLGGTPLRILTLFADTPRALAVSPDGNTVYVGGLPLRQPDHRDHRGRGLQRLPGAAPAAPTVRGAGGLAGGSCPAAAEPATPGSAAAPEAGLIVQFDGDELAATRSAATGTTRVRFSLPDRDVFAIEREHAAPRAPSSPRRHDPVQHGREPGRPGSSTSRTPSRRTRCASRARASSAAARCRATSPSRASP